jgi:hypothetical protein
MKPWPILMTIGCLALAGCADPMEKRTGDEVSSQLQRGVSGQGQIGPEQREPGDPAGANSVPQTHP